MSFSEALASDRVGELESAAALYETVLDEGDRSLRVILNLALLYWRATDFGLATHKRLSHAFFHRAFRRFPELLEEAQRRFPESTEVRFWSRYTAWTDLGGPPLDPDWCKGLLREDPTQLVPAMHLYGLLQGRKAYHKEAEELLRRCREDGTTGARYVVSFIEGVMKRDRHRG